MPVHLPRLVALTPGDLESGDLARASSAVKSALSAGLPGLLLREPRLPDRTWLSFARGLRELCDAQPAPVWFGVHDRVHLAREVAADAVHLGFRSLAMGVLRAQEGGAHEPWCLGLSAHADDQAESWGAADYLFFGPVLDSPSKPPGHAGRRSAVGFAGLARAVASTDRPLLALGGLQPEHVASVRGAGAHGLAVLSGILKRDSPAAATRRYLEELAGA